MKVFLSWSGAASKAVATTLHGWLPTVIQTVRPYMSAESIDKGERWSLDISKQLEETHFGVICVTPENIEAPWVLFEAGALSKSMEKAKVSPLLFGLGPSDFSGSPMLQFQLTLFKKEDFLKLLHSMNSAAPDTERITSDVLNKSFERAWSELESEISRIDFGAAPGKPKRGKPEASDDKLSGVLDELLTIARSQMKVLRSPEDLLPGPYLVQALERARLLRQEPGVPGDHPAWRDIDENLKQALALVRADALGSSDSKALIVENLDNATGILGYIRRQLYRPRRAGARLPFTTRTMSGESIPDLDGALDSNTTT